MYTFQDLFEMHAAASLDKQRRLQQLCEGQGSPTLLLDRAELRFEHGLRFAVQVLGSESQIEETWLWCWANTQLKVPAEALKTAGELREFGNAKRIFELTEPSFSLDIASGQQIGMVAAGLSKADAFFRFPYEGGAAYVLLDAPPLRDMMDDTPACVADIFSELIEHEELDHRRAYLCYLKVKQYSIEEKDDRVEAKSPAGDELVALFDLKGRLAQFGLKGAGGGQIAYRQPKAPPDA